MNVHAEWVHVHLRVRTYATKDVLSPFFWWTIVLMHALHLHFPPL